LKPASLLYPATLEKMKLCTNVEFPICLGRTLLKMFGANGKELLDSMIIDGTFGKTTISTPKDISTFYDRYVERLAGLLGDDFARVFEFEDFNEMKFMLCTKCTLYEREFQRRNLTGRR
jgi:hypothetical protein